MPFFPCAHAAHPLWQHAAKQVIVQLHAQISLQKEAFVPGLGLVYVSAPYAEHASSIVSMLAQALPQVRHWAGSATPTVLAGDMNYGHAGALAVMLPCVSDHSYRLFSGMASANQIPKGFGAHLALVHGDANTPSLREHLQAVASHMPQGQIAGGLCGLHGGQVQVAWGGHMPGSTPSSIGGGGVQMGGISGVMFAQDVPVKAVEMQGYRLTGDSFVANRVDSHAILELDGQPALDALFERLGLVMELTQAQPNADYIWGKLRQTLLASGEQQQHGRSVSRVQPIKGLDPLRRAIVLDAPPPPGHRIALCHRDESTAHNELRRACAEVWEALTPDLSALSSVHPTPVPQGHSIGGAIYIRSQERHAQVHTPQIDEELQIIRHALGPVPLLGFASTSEVDTAGVQHLSAQLIVFTQPLQSWA